VAWLERDLQTKHFSRKQYQENPVGWQHCTPRRVVARPPTAGTLMQITAPLRTNNSEVNADVAELKTYRGQRESQPGRNLLLWMQGDTTQRAHTHIGKNAIGSQKSA
jgi:hypothetical protein